MPLPLKRYLYLGTIQSAVSIAQEEGETPIDTLLFPGREVELPEADRSDWVRSAIAQGLLKILSVPSDQK